MSADARRPLPGRARRRLALALATLAWACGGESGPRNLVMISLDTVRADHLGAYGSERPTSPNLDAFAAEGVLFERAVAPAPWTLPTHASVFTGLYPGRHGVRTRDHRLGAGIPTLAEALSNGGFETAAVVNALFLADVFGLARGFDHYELIPEDDSPAGAASRVTDAGLRWLEGRRDRRVFLFLHYFDVHSDYRSLPRYERMFSARRDGVDGTTEQLLQVNRGERSLEPGEVEQLGRLYDAGIRQLDDELGRLFARLEDAGWLDDSLVVVFSDHGEQLFEHGGVLHTRTHYQELLHVPLVLRGPSLPRGVRVDALVSLVDLLPTVLGLLGQSPAAGLDGVDLRPLWAAGGASPARWVFAETGPSIGTDSARSVQDGRFKLIVDVKSGRRELYDLVLDPGEQHDRLAERPEVARQLEARLERLDTDRREGARAPELGEETREHLRQLGYE